MCLKPSLFFLFLLPLAAQTNVLTVHNDVARTGQNLAETILTTTNVNSATFGKLFEITLDGAVDAQALYVSAIPVSGQTHNLLIVATENDSLYALDADTGAQLWKTVLLPEGETPSDDRKCPSQVYPQIGVSSTPAIAKSPGSTEGAVFAVAMSKDAAGNYHHRLYKVNLTAGLTLAKVEVAAQYPGTGSETNGSGVDVFNPKQYKERAALLLLNSVVYVSWASHCDGRPYTGWIMGYNANTMQQSTVLNITPNGEDGGMWSSGAGMAADTSGNIYWPVGNGTFDTTLNAAGFPINGDFGNAFLKLSTANNQLSVADYFDMYNTDRESDSDSDLGAGGVIVLPDMNDATGATRHLAIGAGKDHNIYLVDRDNMGKFNPQNNNAIYQEVVGVLTGGIWGMPAYYGGRVYFGAVNSPMREFQFTNAKVSSSPVSVTSTAFPYPGTSPSISANASSNAIVWAVEINTPSVLHAYLASNLAHELYNSSQASNGRDQFGAGSKFIPPTIVNGKVYVSTSTGVAVFGLFKAQ
jgi:hypothetical protein